MSDLPPPAEFAEVVFQAHPPQFRATAHLTPAGLLAIGGLVSAILLSTSVLVWTAVAASRERHTLKLGERSR